MANVIIGSMKQTPTSDIKLLRIKVPSGRWMFCLAPTGGDDVSISHAQLPKLIEMLQAAYRDTSAMIARNQD